MRDLYNYIFIYIFYIREIYIGYIIFNSCSCVRVGRLLDEFDSFRKDISVYELICRLISKP